MKLAAPAELPVKASNHHCNKTTQKRGVSRLFLPPPTPHQCLLKLFSFIANSTLSSSLLLSAPTILPTQNLIHIIYETQVDMRAIGERMLTRLANILKLHLFKARRFVINYPLTLIDVQISPIFLDRYDDILDIIKIIIIIMSNYTGNVFRNI